MALIALIEDEPLLRGLFESKLKSSGHAVVTATNGKEGWDLIGKRRPDLILLDLLMPVMSGYDFLVKLRADEQLKGIPCVVISNSGQVSDLNRAYDCGADDVLIKADFNPEQLIHKVDEQLRKHGAVLPAVTAA